MTTSSLIVDYLGEGLAADRPASLTISAAALGLYFATDTAVLSAWDGSGWITVGGSSAAAPYTLGVFVPGTMTNGQVLLVHQLPQAVTFPANFGASAAGGSSLASALANATASTTITVGQCLAANDPTSPSNFTGIGTLTFGASGHAAALATSGGTAKAFAAGDWLQLSIATADVTLANFTTTLVADRN